jgi:hypothetical protein
LRKPARRAGAGPPPPRERSAEERAATLLLRLETSGPNPVQAAEELDRLQGALRRAERLEPLRERVADLAAAWAQGPLRGERGRAWLTLVGAFGLSEHGESVARLAADPGLPAALRIPACRVLAQLRAPEAAGALLEVAGSRAEPAVRAAAVEGLMDLGDSSVRPTLQALLDQDLPRPLWVAVNAALDRL